MGTLHTWWKHWLLPLWVHQKYPHPTSLFLSTILLYLMFILAWKIFFLSITDEFVTSLVCSAKWLKKKPSSWSKVGPIKSMRGWYVICMCVCANYCVRGPRQREVPGFSLGSGEVTGYCLFELAQPLSTSYSSKQLKYLFVLICKFAFTSVSQYYNCKYNRSIEVPSYILQ